MGIHFDRHTSGEFTNYQATIEVNGMSICLSVCPQCRDRRVSWFNVGGRRTGLEVVAGPVAAMVDATNRVFPPTPEEIAECNVALAAEDAYRAISNGAARCRTIEEKGQFILDALTEAALAHGVSPADVADAFGKSLVLAA